MNIYSIFNTFLIAFFFTFSAHKTSFADDADKTQYLLTKEALQLTCEQRLKRQTRPSAVKYLDGIVLNQDPFALEGETFNVLVESLDMALTKETKRRDRLREKFPERGYSDSFSLRYFLGLLNSSAYLHSISQLEGDRGLPTLKRIKLLALRKKLGNGALAAWLSLYLVSCVTEWSTLKVFYSGFPFIWGFLGFDYWVQNKYFTNEYSSAEPMAFVRKLLVELEGKGHNLTAALSDFDSLKIKDLQRYETYDPDTITNEELAEIKGSLVSQIGIVLESLNLRLQTIKRAADASAKKEAELREAGSINADPQATIWLSIALTGSEIESKIKTLKEYKRRLEEEDDKALELIKEIQIFLVDEL